MARYHRQRRRILHWVEAFVMGKLGLEGGHDIGGVLVRPEDAPRHDAVVAIDCGEAGMAFRGKPGTGVDATFCEHTGGRFKVRLRGIAGSPASGGTSTVRAAITGGSAAWDKPCRVLILSGFLRLTVKHNSDRQ